MSEATAAPFVVGELAGHGVRLEPLQPTHIEGLTACARRGGDGYRFTSVPPKGVGMEAYVALALAEQARGAMAPFAVLTQPPGEAVERVVGSTRFAHAERWPWPGRAAGDHHIDALEIGWTWLDPAVQRTRVNTACKLLLLSCAFETLRVVRVSLKTDERNAQSRAAIERLGAHFDGILRAHMLTTDGTAVRNSAFYSLLAEEWPRAKARLTARLETEHK